MAVEYTNRIGKTYYLCEGKTKTEKPRYFFSAQPEGKGKPVEEIPEGFEIYENPENAQVFLRKRKPQLITDIEKHLVEKYVNKLKRSKRYHIDCKGEYITIYESNADIENLKGLFGGLLKNVPLREGLNFGDAMQAIVNAADQHYSAVMKFGLIDKERRLFIAERFCFRGSIDDWIEISSPNALKKLAKKYIKRLGTEGFYDLF